MTPVGFIGIEALIFSADGVVTLPVDPMGDHETAEVRMSVNWFGCELPDLDHPPRYRSLYRCVCGRKWYAVRSRKSPRGFRWKLAWHPFAVYEPHRK
jgi:hypothetical protein